MSKKTNKVNNAANLRNEIPTKDFGVLVYKNNYKNYLELTTQPISNICWEDDYDENINYENYLMEEGNRRKRLKEFKKSSKRSRISKDGNYKTFTKKHVKRNVSFTKGEKIKITKLW